MDPIPSRLSFRRTHSKGNLNLTAPGHRPELPIVQADVGPALPEGIRRVSKIELTRRKFVSRSMKVGLGVAAVTGGLIGFAPSADALSCLTGSSETIGSCSQSCVGRCSYEYSSCVYLITGYTGTEVPWICQCLNYCYAAKAACQCKLTDGYGSGLCCCVACPG